MGITHSGMGKRVLTAAVSDSLGRPSDPTTVHSDLPPLVRFDVRVERTILNGGDIFSAVGLGDSDSYHDTNRFGKFVPPSGS